jgi:hypothetical protein
MQRGPLSHKQGVSYTNLVSGLAVTLNLNYYSYYLNTIINRRMISLIEYVGFMGAKFSVIS